jgi:SAM-dependent methyltransferase
MNDKATEESGSFYAKAAKIRTASTSCCTGATPALASGYQEDVLSQAPDEAVSASFGCGDPIAFSDIEDGQTVLDLGCGAGLDLILAGEKVGATGQVIGIDASDEMLPLAKANVERAGMQDRVVLRLGAIEELPVEDRSVDRVVSNCVVNLSTDKPRVFREIHRVLKPGGAAVIADLVADHLPEWVSTHRDLYSACVAGAVSEATYVQLARDAGFDEIEVIARMTYDSAMVRGLIADALPVAVDDIADRLSMAPDDLLEMAGTDLAGCITSIKLRLKVAAS